MEQARTKEKETFENMALVLVGCKQAFFFFKGQDCQLIFYTDKLQLGKFVHTLRINIFS